MYCNLNIYNKCKNTEIDILLLSYHVYPMHKHGSKYEPHILIQEI